MKLARLKNNKNASAASMITTLKMAKEDTAQNLIDGTMIAAEGNQSGENLTFLDNLYNTNTVYRHLFPDTQSLGTDEKEILIKHDELANVSEEDNDEGAENIQECR